MTLLAGIPGPTALAADSSACRVRNVTQDTRATSLKAMVAAAQDGDTLRVRGTCRGAVIERDLTIVGVDDDAILTGRDQDRVLRIRAGATVTLRHLRIAHGLAQTGGAIHNRGDLTMVDTIVQRNFGSGGGGIATYGVLRMKDSIVRRNRSWYAGGVYVGAGKVTLTRTRVTDNRSVDQGTGGGILNGAIVTLVDSVVARNRVDGGAAGIDNEGVLTLIGSTIRENRSGGWDLDDAGGGGIQNSGQLVLTDSKVIGNSIGGGPGAGGGIFNWSEGTVSLDGTSSVTGNAPDDCVGTPACS